MTSTPSLPTQIEAREPGWYWVRVREDGPWLAYCWHHSDGEAFWLARSEPFWMARSEDDQPIFEIGPRIPDPVTLQQRERLEALVKAAREWVRCDCPRATPRLPTEQAIVDALAALGTADEVELELARRDTKENVAKF